MKEKHMKNKRKMYHSASRHSSQNIETTVKTLSPREFEEKTMLDVA
jgi:hypothetical protein